MDEELRFHLEEQIQTNLAAGMAPAEARRAASVRLGNTALIKEDTGAVWRWGWWDAARQDLRLAVRLLPKQRDFSALAVVVLALGTGANTAVFSAANDVSPNDPLALLAAATALLCVGWLASLTPARHAARTNPMAALRAE